MNTDAEKKAKWLKTAKWIYWTITVSFSGLMLLSASGMLMGGEANLEGLAHLGYPAYFAKILGAAKLLGVIAILYGRFRILKEWAYAGFTFNIIAASASHAFSGDELMKVVVPLIFLVLLLVSYRQWKTGWM